MAKDNLIEDFKKEFESAKKEFNVVPTFDELDSIFMLRDFIMKEGYVSTSVLLTCRSRITELYSSWNNYFHNLIMPNPNYMPGMAESKLFDKSERDEIILIMNKIMVFLSGSSKAAASRNDSDQADLINEMFNYWPEFQEKTSKIIGKVHAYWSGLASKA